MDCQKGSMPCKFRQIAGDASNANVIGNMLFQQSGIDAKRDILRHMV